MSLRAEAAKGVAGTLRIYCVVDGLRVAASSSGHTYKLTAPDGTTLLDTTSCSSTTASGLSYFSLAVPAIATLYEGCRATLTWRDAGGNEQVTVSFFDVVTTPWSRIPRVTLDDLQAMRPDVTEDLDRLGVLLGYMAGSVAQTNAAANFSSLAREELDAELRSRAAADEQIRPALIFDADRLAPIERLLTLALIYESIADDPSEDDSSTDGFDGLARHYRKQAQNALKALRCVYDVDQDGVADGEPQAPAVGIVFRRRVQ